MSICEVFPTFQEIPPSLSSGCVGGLVAPKLMTGVIWCPVYVYIRPVAAWNATPLFIGRSQKAIALGLCYILLVAESVSRIVFK
jgi:hypothetical protein